MLRGAVKRVIKDDLLNTYQDFLRRWVCGVYGACTCGTGVGQPAADKQPALFGAMPCADADRPLCRGC